MTGIDDAALLAVVAIGSALGASALPRASWPRRSPAAAILLWQALGLASGLAAVGTLIGLALPASNGGLVSFRAARGRPAAATATSSAWPAVRPQRGGRRAAGPGRGPAGLPGGRAGPARLAVLGAARRLGRGAAGQAAAAGAAHAARPRRPEGARRARRGLPERGRVLPARAASRSRIVVSVGALELLGRGELAAVLAHERAHLRERHDLVLLPFTALRRAFPGPPPAPAPTTRWRC